MPNHCTNSLTITGPTEDVESVILLLKGEDGTLIDFNKLIPMPDEISTSTSPNRDRDEAVRLKAAYGHTDWYSWAIGNWGTKWNAYSMKTSADVTALELLAQTNDDSEKRTVEYTFDTAWSPPSPVITKLATLFPRCQLVHLFVDEGGGFTGAVIYEEGECRQEEVLVPTEVEDIYALSAWHQRFSPANWENEE